MKLELRKLHAFFSRCIHMFVLNGTTKAYGVILESIVQSYQTQHAFIGAIFTSQASVSFLIAPFAHLIEDALSPRLVAVIGGFLATTGFIGLAFLLHSSMWYLLLFMVISGIGFGLVNYVTTLCLMDSFKEDFPSAYTITSFSSYLGVAALPPILGYIVIMYGEQVGLLAFAILSSLQLISGMFTSLENESLHTSEETALGKTEDDEITSEKENLIEEEVECDYTPSESLDYWRTLFSNHPAYICLLLTTFIFSFQYIAWSIYLVPYGESLGLNSTSATYLSTAGGVAGIGGKIYGLMLFRWEVSVIPAGVIMPTILLSIAYGISLLSADFIVLILMAILSGFCISLLVCVSAAWIPKTTCASHFKGAVSVRFFVSGVAKFLGGFLPGLVVDVTGSYRPAFASMALLSLIGTIISVIWYMFNRRSAVKVDRSYMK